MPTAKRARTTQQDSVGGTGRPLIERDGLLAALDRATTGKVAIIAAPAGSGKTSLLRAWADRRAARGQVAMVQVQRDQQDAQHFWLALGKAVRELSGTPTSAEPAAGPDFTAHGEVGLVLPE